MKMRGARGQCLTVDRLLLVARLVLGFLAVTCKGISLHRLWLCCCNDVVFWNASSVQIEPEIVARRGR